MLLHGPHNPQNCLLPVGILGAMRVNPLPNRISAVFADIINVTDRQTDTHTDRPRYSVCSYCCDAAY